MAGSLRYEEEQLLVCGEREALRVVPVVPAFRLCTEVARARARTHMIYLSNMCGVTPFGGTLVGGLLGVPSRPPVY